MRKHNLLLIIILVIAAVLRFYRLDSAPPSISWDEAAVGYNAYTIANYGRDEYGKFFPLYFRSFRDDKHPIHIYFTALSVKIMGLNEFSTRFPAALFGVMNVLLLYYLAKLLFNNKVISFSASLFLAISPFNLHFSHFNHEANFVLFFFMLGAVFFYLAVKRKSVYLIPSISSFFISFISYHPAKVIVPIIFALLFFLYIKKLIINKKIIVVSVILISLFALIIYLNPPLLGFARIQQTSLGLEEIKKTNLYNLTKNEFLGKINLVIVQYSWHFLPRFLFISGDKNARLSSQSTGEFYKIDAVFLLAGLIFLILKRSKEGLFVISWVLLAPLPSSLVGESPHAARASLMMGSWHLVSAIGFYSILNLLKKQFLRVGFTILIFIILSISLAIYLKYYYGQYAKRYAIDWQYGMKQVVEYARVNNEYEQIYATPERSQPYIFFLYFLKTPLPDYLNTVIYNNAPDKTHNNVASFDKYFFTGWNPLESDARRGVLYILTPSEYDGLKFRSDFDVKKVIYYPNDTTAFFLVSLR